MRPGQGEDAAGNSQIRYREVMRGNIVANFLKSELVKEYVKTNMSPKKMMYYIKRQIR